MAVIIGVLTVVILLLAVAIFLIVTRHRQRKNFASPLSTKSAIPSSNHQHLSPESAYGTTEKDPSLMTYRVEELDDRYAGTKLTTLPRDLNDRLLGDVRLDEYQEPFHENKYRESPHAAYYGYSTVVIDNKDLHDNVEQSGEFSVDSSSFDDDDGRGGRGGEKREGQGKLRKSVFHLAPRCHL